MDRFILALHGTALAADKGISGLARRLGRSTQTFINKLNPENDLSLPSIGDFVAIMDDTGDTAPLEVLCEMFGGQFVSATSERCSSVLVAVCRAASEGGDVFKTVEDALADDVISDVEKVAIHREIQDARKALTVLENTLNKS